MSNERLSGLYWDRCQIGKTELDKIVIMLLGFADDIWLNANSWPKDLDDEGSKKVQERLEGLVEQGLVKLWSYPPNRQPPSVPFSLASRFPRSKITELDLNVSKEMHDGVVEALSGYARKMPRFVGTAQDEKFEFEGVVEFVNLGSQLWSLSVANHLGASQIMASARSISGFGAQLSKYQFYASSAEPAFRQFLTSRFPAGIAALSLKDIISLRKYSVGVREFVSNALRDVDLDFESPNGIEIATERIELEYMRLLEDELMKSQPQKFAHVITEEAIMTAVGFISPILQGLPWLVALWHWQQEKQKRKSPVYFMLELRKRARQ